MTGVQTCALPISGVWGGQAGACALASAPTPAALPSPSGAPPPRAPRAVPRGGGPAASPRSESGTVGLREAPRKRRAAWGPWGRGSTQGHSRRAGGGPCSRRADTGGLGEGTGHGLPGGLSPAQSRGPTHPTGEGVMSSHPAVGLRAGCSPRPQSWSPRTCRPPWHGQGADPYRLVFPEPGRLSSWAPGLGLEECGAHPLPSLPCRLRTTCLVGLGTKVPDRKSVV